QVSDALLNAEYNRERGHVVKMRWNAWVADDDSSTERIEVMFDNEWPENTSLTLFKTETKVHDSEIASNGVVTHYDVVTDMFVTNLNASSPNFLLDSNTSEIWYESSTSYSQSDGFDSVIGFDIQGNADGYVAVFENQGDVLAVIGITGNANSPENSSNNTNLALFFLFGALAASSIVTYRKPQE
ncbi:MAG: hypothetical protein QF440_02965, partial [Candidatus Thalassarchaeaceae archaeon]|nr:hypothetical protein [Candidatus Thalassarchaeaceae archaeon]